jgi:putative ABC transport system permease protein
MKLERGRYLNQQDFDDERAVCVIGEDVKKQLFNERSALGAQVHIGNVPFTVVGELAKKDQNNSYNGMDGNKALIPYTTMARYFPDGRPFIGQGYINNIILMPVTADKHEEAVKQVKALLGKIHGFDPADESAIWSWDTVESAKMVAKIYDSMQIFLSFMAGITLALGGIGVMNITLISVAERTREIGVKKAVGAKPRRIMAEFFIEALTLTMLSGVAGLVAAIGLCSLVNRLPLPTLFAGLPVTPRAAAIAIGTLILVGILSAIYPARRAALMQPVEALRHE